MSAILSEGVKPTLAELEKFEESPEGMSIEVAAGEKEDMHNFTNGDRVEVIEGELLNLQGTVTKIDGTKITIMPNECPGWSWCSIERIRNFGFLNGTYLKF